MVTHILYEAEGHILIGKQEHTCSRIRQRERLAAEIGECLLKGEFNAIKRFRIEILEHGQSMLRNNGLSAQFTNTEARADADKLRIEELDELFVFGRICYHKTVLLANNPLVGMLEPTAHDILKLHGFRDGVLLFWDAERTRSYACFAEGTEVEAFSFGLVWVEVIAGLPFGNSPRWVVRYRQYLCS